MDLATVSGAKMRRLVSRRDSIFGGGAWWLVCEGGSLPRHVRVSKGGRWLYIIRY